MPAGARVRACFPAASSVSFHLSGFICFTSSIFICLTSLTSSA
ncbi:hypothetical protein HMPREF1548_05903 [Clostridium sp. KLE 1755]|nr:hypothetical protein HMPREF1548_05903 [Clostridium sp. KLE 1755]